MNDKPYFFDRDVSWLAFNGRVLAEAANSRVPLMERIRFLSIYSSNLDEFYRVRVPALMALNRIIRSEKQEAVYHEVTATVNRQLQQYGEILAQQIVPALKERGIHFLYHEPVPDTLFDRLQDHFFTRVAGFLQPVWLSGDTDFFPANNQLYMAVVLEYEGEREERLYLVNIPCDNLPRFLKMEESGTQYLLFLEDIIRVNLPGLFPGATIKGAYNIKITRDAELDLQDEFNEDLAEKIEKQLSKRDLGFATRFLYEPGIPLRHLQCILDTFKLHSAAVVEGGKHHNLKDLSALPLEGDDINYPAWPAVEPGKYGQSLFDHIARKDIIVHPPYQSYQTILRFFNEAAINEDVTEIYTTLYRVASDSRIVQALISAARNGKKVSVLVELKARFDEANNIRWAKKMKSAGVKIIYSNNALKVHAKIALVKRKTEEQSLLGLLATGNFNESTARFYTDHILLTAHQPMLQEMESLFVFLAKRKKPDNTDQLPFDHLLVAQFNLQQHFIDCIDREIAHVQDGKEGAITIKLNNLEEAILINKLYAASNAGVKIQLLIRGICRLVPGIPGQSENISIKRIVDRYLEHGRLFLFHNAGQQELFLGSADWMNRNIYRRIEVCFPVYDQEVKKELMHLLDLQWQDNVQAVWINDELDNLPVESTEPLVRSQEAIYRYLSGITNY